MSAKEVFELIAMVINLAIASVGAVVIVGLIVIVAFPEVIQPRGFYRNAIRTAVQPLLRSFKRQLKF